MSASQQGHHPSLQFSLCIPVHQNPSPPCLPQPIFPTFPIPLPPPVLPRVGSIKGCHGNDVMLSGEGRGDWRVIDSVWWRCDVTPCFLLESVIVGICHVRVTFSSPSLLPALFCPSLYFSCSQDMPSSFCQCWTRCLRDMVLTPSSTFQDAVQQWVWPCCKCANTPGSPNEEISNLCQHQKINLSSMQQWIGWLVSVFDLVVFQFSLSDSDSYYMKRLAGVGGCSHLISVCRSWDLFSLEHTEQSSAQVRRQAVT